MDSECIQAFRQVPGSRVAEMFSSLSHGHKLTIWTFNLRTVKCDVRDGVNGWSQRREGVAEFIRSRRPALVCVQEATKQMLAFLVSSLDEYDYRGSSRVPGRLMRPQAFSLTTAFWN